MTVDNKNNERKETIKKLNKLADDVLELKKTHRQKRPIVIEFSGSPKSGKTSCINSLELFLKRNGFNVEIIHERASVCPVVDKHSPMFNIWTACTSISGMIGVLERKEMNCDVLILDRGIFDALCWFNWLLSKKMLENEQKEAIEHFLLIDSLIKRIDIVFAFCADPDVSIEREYTYLLTDKPGTIMNKEVLTEYLDSIRKTKKDKDKYFHNIFEIDTSDKNQDEVGKVVTEYTLKHLRDMLMERIGYFYLTDKLKNILKRKKIFNYSDLKTILVDLKFDLREEVENSIDFLQPIPIVVITDKEHSKVLLIKKNPKAVSNDSPEKDKVLLYIGGHPRREDFTGNNLQDFLSICKYTLCREIKEEIGVSLALDKVEPFFIYTPTSDISKKHIGVCFLLELDIDSLRLRLDPQELVLNKGTSKSGRFQNIDSLSMLETDFESWSIEIAKHCFNIKLSILDYINE